MRKIKFAPGEYYHIFNHSVDERTAFPTDPYFGRFLVCLVTFNDKKRSPQKLSRFVKDPFRLINRYTPDERDKLVEIIAFTLLPTHYHLFVRERVENGISRFMHCLDKGYARYFNLKNDRSGSLWQGVFGAKHIDDESYFIHIMSYVHLNILDLYCPGWRKGKIEDWSKVTSKLNSYSWSSYAHYRTGSSQIPFINLILTPPEWLSEYYPDPSTFEENLRTWSARFLD